MPKQSPIPYDADTPFYQGASEDRRVLRICCVVTAGSIRQSPAELR